MKTYRQFSEEAQQLDEIGPGALLGPVKWAAGKAIGDAVWKILKGTGKVTGNVLKKGADALKHGSGTKTGESTPSPEPGLPRAS